jgi:hypothetical protein
MKAPSGEHPCSPAIATFTAARRLDGPSAPSTCGGRIAAVNSSGKQVCSKSPKAQINAPESTACGGYCIGHDSRQLSCALDRNSNALGYSATFAL